MTNTAPKDNSNGYEEIADHFINARNNLIGGATIQKWSQSLPRGAAVLDLGCGHGVPVSQTLINEGFAVYGVDASSKLIAAFRKRFPSVQAECCSVEESEFFGLTFDGIVAVGLIFLLPVETQKLVLRKAANALNLGGKFVFTSPQNAISWSDSLTMRESISLGAAAYWKILTEAGLVLDGEAIDEGENYYYMTAKAYPKADAS
jgi:2-polyprenyl-3-methyl-5-hydroxy-6-metoxy-1,4-benzoquinol methylase